MSVSDALARVAELQRFAAVPAAPATAPADPAAFGTTLESLLGLGPQDPTVSSLATTFPGLASSLGLTGAPGTPPGGARALQIAQAEIGQAEDAPGSNDSARIAAYRTATDGAYAGAPWCAYFVSWAAAQAGIPIGDRGQGYGAVEQIHDWAAQTGRLLPAGVQPLPGDLILFGGRHVGIVESVNADGSLTTVEGNHQNAVSRVERSPAEATGYVRL